MPTVINRCMTRCVDVKLVFAATIAVIVSGCNTDVYDQHFQQPLPKGSRLLYYHENRSGWSDMTYGFAFSVPDEALRNQLIDEWALQLGFDSGLKNNLDRCSLSWWPKPDERTKMERYDWEDRKVEQYKCLWYSKDTQRLYVQYGNW